jgi:hypothetical protein
MSFASVKGAPLGLISVTTLPNIPINPGNSYVLSVAGQPNTSPVLNIYAGTIPQGTHIFNGSFSLAQVVAVGVAQNSVILFNLTIVVDGVTISTSTIGCNGIFMGNPAFSNVSAILPSYRDGASLVVNIQAIGTATGSVPNSITLSGTISTARII